MGQKVHPFGFRLGFNKTWRSRWYSNRDYAKLLHEDGVQLSTAREILGGTEAGFVPIPPMDFIFSAHPEKSGSGSRKTTGRSPFRGRTIEFLNEADGTALAVAPGTPVPQLGSEVVLGEVQARVARVVYHYDKVAPWTPVGDEPNPFWHRNIVVYVRVTSP